MFCGLKTLRLAHVVPSVLCPNPMPKQLEEYDEGGVQHHLLQDSSLLWRAFWCKPPAGLRSISLSRLVISCIACMHYHLSSP